MTVCEGVKYLCDECPYVATQLPKLKAHKQNKHEGNHTVLEKKTLPIFLFNICF